MQELPTWRAFSRRGDEPNGRPEGLFGVGILFVKGKSGLGWFLAVGGLLFILAGIPINLDIYFQNTSLMNTLIMLFMIAAGFGLIVKGLRPHKQKSE